MADEGGAAAAALPPNPDLRSGDAPRDEEGRSPRELLDALLAAPGDVAAAEALMERAFLDARHGCAQNAEAAPVCHERARVWQVLAPDLVAALHACPARLAQLALLAGLSSARCGCPGVALSLEKPLPDAFAAWAMAPDTIDWRTDLQLLRSVFNAWKAHRRVELTSQSRALEAALTARLADKLVEQYSTNGEVCLDLMFALDHLCNGAKSITLLLEARATLAAQDAFLGVLSHVAAVPPRADLHRDNALELCRLNSAWAALRLLCAASLTPPGAATVLARGGAEKAVAVLLAPRDSAASSLDVALGHARNAAAAVEICSGLAAHGGPAALRRLNEAGVVHALFHAVRVWQPPLAPTVPSTQLGLELETYNLLTGNVHVCLGLLAGAAGRAATDAAGRSPLSRTGAPHTSAHWHAATHFALIGGGSNIGQIALRAFWAAAGRTATAAPSTLSLLAWSHRNASLRRGGAFVSLLRGAHPADVLLDPGLPLAVVLQSTPAELDGVLDEILCHARSHATGVGEDEVVAHFVWRCADDAVAAQLAAPPPGPPTVVAWASAALLAPRVPRYGALLVQRPAAPRALAEALLDAAADAVSGACVQLFQALCQALGTLVAEVAPQPGVLLPRYAARHGNRRSERGVVTLFEWRQNNPAATRKSQRDDAEVGDAVAPAAKRQCGAGVLRREDVGKSLPGCARFRIGERTVPALVFVMQRASPVLAEAMAVVCGDAADDASVGAEVPLPLLAGLSADEQHAAFLAAVEFAYTDDVVGDSSDLTVLQPLWLLAHALRMDELCAWVMPQLVCAAARPPPGAEANDSFSIAPLLQLLELTSSHPCSELATAAARALLARLAELQTLTAQSERLDKTSTLWRSQLGDAAKAPYRDALADAMAAALMGALRELFGPVPDEAQPPAGVVA